MDNKINLTDAVALTAVTLIVAFAVFFVGFLTGFVNGENKGERTLLEKISEKAPLTPTTEL